MTIAENFTGEPSSSRANSIVGRSPELKSHEQGIVPHAIRHERLQSQIASFERAGYFVETQAGLQAVVAKARSRRVFRDTLLIAVTAGIYSFRLRAAAGRPVHRVVITVDSSGAVRFV